MKSSTIASTVEVLTPEQERLRLADPRNPQPGQVWERRFYENCDPVTLTVVKPRCKHSPCTVCDSEVVTEDSVGLLQPFSLRDWRRWACPCWRRRKHWAKCVEWK